MHVDRSGIAVRGRSCLQSDWLIESFITVPYVRLFLAYRTRTLRIQPQIIIRMQTKAITAVQARGTTNTHRTHTFFLNVSYRIVSYRVVSYRIVSYAAIESGRSSTDCFLTCLPFFEVEWRAVPCCEDLFPRETTNSTQHNTTQLGKLVWYGT